MPATAQLDRIITLLEGILAAVGGEESPPAGGLQPPDGFDASWDAVARTVTCRWEPVEHTVEIHEFDADPQTLAATMPPGATERTSGRLQGGHTYTYAARCVDGDRVSEWTERITLDIPLKGDEEPSEPDEDDGSQDDEEVPGGDEPAPGGSNPVDVLPELATWTVAIPRGSEGDPDNEYAGEWGNLPGVFYTAIVDGDLAVVFRANAGGVTTENSKYPRSEGRQMADRDWAKGAWSSSEPHELEFEMSIDASDLEARQRVVGAQIHGGGDDVCQVMRHETDGLVLMHSDGDAFEVIDADYQDGQRFTGRIVVVPRPDEDSDLIQVWYEGRLAAEIEARGDSWYFKVGVYVQSNVKDWGESPDACGEVVIWRLVATGDPLA